MNNNTSATFTIEIAGRTYEITRKTYPFREGVELEAEVNGEKIRVSDRQLGEQEALRILTEQITQKTK